MKATAFIRRLPLVGRALEQLESLRDVRAGVVNAREGASSTRGDRIVETALALWRAHIEEPPNGDPADIDDIIRGALGLGWNSANRHRLNERIPYRKNGDFEWCGAFAARCMGEHGLRAPVRRRDFASCYRLQRWARQDRRRIVRLKSIRPGDILVVGDGKVVRGTHITIVERVEGSIVFTIEGNARGVLPDGTVGEGVIRRTRMIGKASRSARCEVSGLSMTMRALHAYRPLPEDYEASP